MPAIAHGALCAAIPRRVGADLVREVLNPCAAPEGSRG